MGIKSIQTSQLRDGSFKVVPGVFKNPFGTSAATGASYAMIDFGVELPGAYVYATEDVVVRVDTVEVELPKGVAVFLPWLMDSISVKQKTTAGTVYVYGGY